MEITPIYRVKPLTDAIHPQKPVMTVDFDGTLDRADVQEYVSALLRQGLVRVGVLTSRFDDLQAHHPPRQPH